MKLILQSPTSLFDLRLHNPSSLVILVDIDDIAITSATTNSYSFHNGSYERPSYHASTAIVAALLLDTTTAVAEM